MKTSKYKIWGGWLAFTFVLLHFGFIIVYALPDQFSNPKLKTFTTPYVEPVFSQTWGMFAPCPTINSSVELKYYFKDDSTDWIDPNAGARAGHAMWRGSHHGELMLAESNLMYWIELDLKGVGVEIGGDFSVGQTQEYYKGYSYFQVENYLLGNAYYLLGKKPTSARIRVYMEDVISGKSGVTELPKFTFE